MAFQFHIIFTYLRIFGRVKWPASHFLQRLKSLGWMFDSQMILEPIILTLSYHFGALFCSFSYFIANIRNLEFRQFHQFSWISYRFYDNDYDKIFHQKYMVHPGKPIKYAQIAFHRNYEIHWLVERCHLINRIWGYITKF